MRSAGHHRRRGSMYVVAVGTAMVVTVIGLSALMAVRVQKRSAEGWNDLIQARLHARSAIEMGLFQLDDAANWRTAYPNGTWIADQSIGTGTFSVAGIDPEDGDLADSILDPLLFTGTGVQGQATYETQVLLMPVSRPLEALNRCLHAAGRLTVNATHALVVSTAGVSTNGHAQIDGAIFGDIEAASYSCPGMVQGTVTVPAPPKQMPNPEVFATYAGIATPFTCPAAITNRVLAPGYNPWGIANPDGVYYVDTGGADLVIEASRIHGTLIVKTQGGKVVLQGAVLLHRYRSSYPVLIVDGDVEMNLASNSVSLSEGDCDTNFNPDYAPYLGNSDSDTLDAYPNEIQGLVHVRGTLLWQGTTRVRGAVICEQTVSCSGFNEIVHDPSLYENPPMGYVAVDRMGVLWGSWRRPVD